MIKLKEKISQAGGVDFDELSGKPMSAVEMEQSLLGIATEIKPTKG